jgi:hypothetical protein
MLTLTSLMAVSSSLCGPIPLPTKFNSESSCENYLRNNSDHHCDQVGAHFELWF